ncbi:MAG: cardiolipin synthase [Clostridia bacterium]|nr:cardiolipin synthase [Clostridia bacterium]
MSKKWVKILFRRRVTVIFLLILQLSLMATAIYSSSQTYRWIYNLLNLISLGVILHIITSAKRASYKLLWTVVVLAFPLFGGPLYLLVQFQGTTTNFRRLLDGAEKTYGKKLNSHEAEKALEKVPADSRHQARFLQSAGGFAIYQNEESTYLPQGERYAQRLLAALESAKKFIFLEFFIIQEGKFWNSILDVLKKKAAEGVDVRLIYDDMGCFMLLPADYQKKLSAAGIRCVVFNKFRPVFSTLQNNRDHRKIAVIDGRVAFTGGINLADEYINEIKRFGHWKDAAIEIKGEAVQGFTRMFLIMWQALTGETEKTETFFEQKTTPQKTDGVIIPFCDSPIDREYVSEQVYINLITSARNYVYIQTPYLILDDTMVSALILAAKNGVDVRIITPGVPDKRYVHMTTRSYYRELIAGGVKIFEYTPGFIHAKVLAADDAVAVVGTINMDCRSLYLHFECGAWLCGSQTVSDIRQDFLKTQKVSKAITAADCRVNFLTRIIRGLFRLLAPLM